MANYYGNRGNGSSLRHYRTKGSRNGYSKNPNYKVVGQKAAGKLVNGRYVYDTGGGTKSGSRRPLTDYQQMARNEYLAQPGKKNNWQQQANYASAMGTAANNFNSGRISAYDDRGSQHRKYTDADGNPITVHNHHIGAASIDNSGNSHAYGVQMRKRIHELSQQGKKVGNGAKEQAYAMSNGHANTNDYSPQQQQAAYTNSKLNTAAGKLDMAKRKANVAMVNAKKKLQKKFSKDNEQTKGGPKTKAMTTGTTLYSNGPGGPITYSYSSGHGYTPSANGGLIGHLTANMLNTHAPTSNVHAVGGQNQQHTGNAKRQQEVTVKRKSAKGAMNDWQKQAASAQANAMAANRVNSGQSQAANVQENKKGFLGILKDKRKTYQMSNKTNKIIGDYVSKKKTESKLTAAEQRRKDEKKAKKIVKKGKKKLNKLLSYMNKETK